MSHSIVLCFALFVAYALAAGQVQGSGGNIPAPGTSGMLTTLPITWTTTVPGVIVPGSGNSFTLAAAANVTFSAPVGTWSINKACVSPAYNAILTLWPTSGTATPYQRTFTGLSGNFASVTGSVNLAAGSYVFKIGPACASYPPSYFLTVNNFGVTATAA